MADGVEAVGVAGAAVAVDPGEGDLADLAALLPGDGLQRVAEAGAGAGLHLHERDDLAARARRGRSPCGPCGSCASRIVQPARSRWRAASASPRSPSGLPDTGRPSGDAHRAAARAGRGRAAADGAGDEPDLLPSARRTAAGRATGRRRRGRAPGSGCTSTMSPSAPAATAARAMGMTLARMPVPWLGSAMIGRCESDFTTGMAVRSRRLRVWVSKPRTPRSQRITCAVALGEDVLGGEEELLHRGGHAALEEDRLARAAGAAQEREVLHVARADLHDVGVLGDQVRRPRGRCASVTTAIPVSSRARASSLQALLAHPLEGVGGGAGLEGAAAQDGGAGVAQPVRDLQDLRLRLHGAGARHDHDLAAADPRAVRELDDGGLLAPLARDLLVGLRDVDDLHHAREGLQAARVHLAVVADQARRRCAASPGWGRPRSPSLGSCRRRPRSAAGVALCAMTTSMRTCRLREDVGTERTANVCARREGPEL